MRKFFMLGAIAPALLLSACGEGWEMRTYSQTPYGGRTAGSGVEYVRVAMMPERGPVIRAEEPANQVIVIPEEAPALTPVPMVTEEEGTVDKMIQSGEKFFRDLQKK